MKPITKTEELTAAMERELFSFPDGCVSDIHLVVEEEERTVAYCGTVYHHEECKK